MYLLEFWPKNTEHFDRIVPIYTDFFKTYAMHKSQTVAIFISQIINILPKAFKDPAFDLTGKYDY